MTCPFCTLSLYPSGPASIEDSPRTRLAILVDGNLSWVEDLPTYAFPEYKADLLENLVGSTICQGRFTGTINRVEWLPAGAPLKAPTAFAGIKLAFYGVPVPQDIVLIAGGKNETSQRLLLRVQADSSALFVFEQNGKAPQFSTPINLQLYQSITVKVGFPVRVKGTASSTTASLNVIVNNASIWQKDVTPLLEGVDSIVLPGGGISSQPQGGVILHSEFLPNLN